MAKKNFITGFDALLQSTADEVEQVEVGADAGGAQAVLPQREEQADRTIAAAPSDPSRTRGRGRPKTNMTGVRATFIVEADVLDKVKALAYWERKQIKDILDEALNEYLRKYEKKNGTIEPLR